MKPYYEKYEKKSKIPLVLGIFVIIAVITGGILFFNQTELTVKTLEGAVENGLQNAVSTSKSNQEPTFKLETGSSEAILNEEISENREFNLQLEPGRYLISFSPDARVKVYQEGRELYAEVKTETQGNYYFDINSGENSNVIVSVQPRTQTKIMLVQKARFK